MNVNQIFAVIFIILTTELSLVLGDDVVVVAANSDTPVSEATYNVLDTGVATSGGEVSTDVTSDLEKSIAQDLENDVIKDSNHDVTQGENVDVTIDGVADVTDNGENEATDTLPALYNHIRLPNTIRPTFYEISIFPHTDDQDPEAFTYDCTTVINITCIEDTRVVILHSLDNNILDWSVTDGDGNTHSGHLRHNEDMAMIELHLGLFSLIAGRSYILTIHANSSLASSLRGLYASPYKHGNKTEYILTTMMEPTDARSVFPCFDEPDFKAIFTFRIKRRAGVSSFTNLPRRITEGPDEDGYYTDIFDQPQNVPMSSYLVAIAIGDLDFLESSVNGVQFRTISRPSVVNQTSYALEIGMKLMEFFENYFDIPYSLPKEDMIAVPTMSFAGMEHWGLITYRESAMLNEEGVSSLEDKEWTTIIIAHEIAHQWFGNLVSPYWWDDLWLNEGFATYMMYLAVDRVIPEWKMIEKLIVDFRGVQNVMKVDDSIQSHPVYCPVYDPIEISQIFDLISYAKGGAVIRMMNFFLGEETFRKGLTKFLRTYSYKTATHINLWESLAEQAREDEHSFSDVMDVMSTWILEENYPVVMVTKTGEETLEITQSAFLRTAEQRQLRSNITWRIPFAYTTDLDGNFDKTYKDIHWLNDRTLIITDENLANTKWIIGNVLQYGFYRVNYDEDIWEAILDQLATDHTVIHTINRAQIINDAWNLARAGMLDFNIALRTFDYLDSETEFVPWKAAIRELDSLKSHLQLDYVYGAFENFMRTKLKKAYEDTVGATSHLKRIQHTMIAKEACRYGLLSCVREAQSEFDSWVADPSKQLDPELTEMIYCIGVKYGGYEAWEAVLHRYKSSQSISDKRFLVNALTCIDKPWVFYQLLELMMETDTFYKTEKVVLLMNMMKSSVGRLLLWSILDKYWGKLVDTYIEDTSLFTGILDAMAGSINTNLELKMFQYFLSENDKVGKVRILVENVFKNRETELDRYFTVVKDWLLQNYGSNLD